MELAKSLGLDPILLAAQIVNFLIVFFVLKKLLYKPVLKVLKEREISIKKGLNDAEEARKLLEKTQQEEKDILKKAQISANKLLADAKTETETMLKSAQELAKKQTDRMIQEAKEEITRETKDAQEKLARHVSTLAVDFLQKAISDLFTEKEQGEIMTKAMRKLRQKSN